MKYRGPFLLGLSALGVAGAFTVACNTVVEVVAPVSDSGSDTSTEKEAGPLDGGSKPDAKAIPLCTTNAVKGECDLVSQNCPNGQECVAPTQPDGGTFSLCQAPGAGALAEGELCTPGTDNPCIKGLQCQAGRCSHPCCGNGTGVGDSTVCGKTKEGYVGICELNIVDSKNNALYSVCDYAKPCQPFGVQPCGASQTCLVKDGVGTSACSDIFMAPGKNVGALCTAANDCGDGMMCVGGGTNNVCTYVCWNKASKTPLPFDGGALSGGAGGGGCPGNKVCKVVNWGGSLPDWLGTCP